MTRHGNKAKAYENGKRKFQAGAREREALALQLRATRNDNKGKRVLYTFCTYCGCDQIFIDNECTICQP